MFEGYTTHAKKTLARPKEVAREYGKREVESEHVLVALLELGEGIAIDILEELWIDCQECLGNLREQIDPAGGSIENLETVCGKCIR